MGRSRNTVYFPKSEGPLYYRKATVATYEVDWFLEKGALLDQDEAARIGAETEAEKNAKVLKKKEKE